MSTRSLICEKIGDDKYKAIYVYNIAIIVKHFFKNMVL